MIAITWASVVLILGLGWLGLALLGWAVCALFWRVMRKDFKDFGRKW